jgi:hypothetical protein
VDLVAQRKWERRLKKTQLHVKLWRTKNIARFTNLQDIVR